MSAPAAKQGDPRVPEVPQGFELIDGELVPKETSGEHSLAQANLAASLVGPYGRRPAGGPPDRPGGWWFETEALIEFGPQLRYRPDVAGWRRHKAPSPPTGALITLIPDWICEIISPANASNDTVKKMRAYHLAHVSHYWLLDPRQPGDETLEVYRWTQDGYLVVLRAQRGERVRAEPFQDRELQVGVLFGEDEE